MLPILTPITSSQSEIIARTWQRRAQREAHLALRFGSLQNALRAHEATPTVLKLVEQTAQDCQRHVEAYLTVARNFEPAAQIESPSRPGPLAPPQLSIEEKIVYELVALSCIEETLTGALFGKVYALAKHPKIKLTAHLAFQDEIWHSRLGWAHLGNWGQSNDVTWLSEHLSQLLVGTEHHELFDKESHHLPSEYGELNRSAKQELLRESLVTIILPGLESFGIEITQGRQWLKAFSDNPSNDK